MPSREYRERDHMDVVVRKRTLERLGLTHYGAIHENLPPARLIEAAVRRREGMLAESGALVAKTGKRTGRSPKDRFVVDDEATRDKVDWGAVNKPFSTKAFEVILDKATSYLSNLEEFYVVDAYAGADPRYRLNVQVAAEYAWHALFARQLFRRPSREELEHFEPEWTVLSVPGFLAEPEEDGTGSETFVCIDFSRKVVLVAGTGYAGEIKKSIFSVMNFVLPIEHGVVPMHCLANVGERDDVALFFGLSGTGKTTLSADPERRLIGDDEHGWSDNNIFNFEGGCYAKCINLKKENEPQIWNAIRFGTVMENVVVKNGTREPDFSDDTLTENTRAAYPLEFIPNSIIPSLAGHPKVIIFLTADAFGVMPPIAKLSKEAAMYHFMSGYTSKLAGTERGITEPKETFSHCFGAPFMPLHASKYAQMLGKKITEHGTRVYLINTGWTGGPYGLGKRMNLTYTRAMVTAAIKGKIEEVTTKHHEIFNLDMPTSCSGVPNEVLDPRNTWSDKEKYDAAARRLAAIFARSRAWNP